MDKLEMARLNMLVKPCEKHNNSAKVSVLEGEMYISTGEKCECIMYCEPDDIEGSVNWWNERPYQEKLVATYIREVADNLTLSTSYRNMRKWAHDMARVLVQMQDTNIIDITTLNSAYETAKGIIELYRMEKEQEEARVAQMEREGMIARYGEIEEGGANG